MNSSSGNKPPIFKCKRGFTLVELLVTISLLAVLTTVSIVGYMSFIERAAVSNDENLVAQLNSFKDAYVVNMKDDFDKEDIKIIIIESGIEELRPQSEKYGYGFYFVMDIKIFALLRVANAEGNGNYLKLPDELYSDDTPEPLPPVSEPDNPSGGTGEGTNEGTGEGANEGTGEGANEGTGEGANESEDIDLTNISVIYNENNKQTGDKGEYIYSENGELHAGIILDDENQKGVEINCGNLLVNDKYSVSAIKINGKETNIITSTGYTEIELTLENGKTATVNLEVENLSGNAPENTWKIEALSDLPSKCEYKDGKLNILIFEGLTFYYYEYGWYGANKSNYGDMKDYLNVIIVVNGEQYNPEIFKNENDNYNYYASVTGFTEKPSSYTIIYEIGPNDGSGFCDRFAVTVQN